jgi:uncharacterized OsmC-like protein
LPPIATGSRWITGNGCCKIGAGPTVTETEMDIKVTHDLYNAALGACKALTVLTYAKRKDQLHATLAVIGQLTADQRQEMLTVAGKCPVHKPMMQVSIEIATDLAPMRRWQRCPSRNW